MLRLVTLTACGLFVVMSIAGRDLSESELLALAELNGGNPDQYQSLAGIYTAPNMRRGTYLKPLDQLPEAEWNQVLASRFDGESDLVQLANLDTPATMSDAMPEVLGMPDAAVLRKVSANVLNVRGGPSTSHEVLGQVVRADIVTVVSDPSQPWVKIRVEGDGVEGYIAAKYLIDAQ